MTDDDYPIPETYTDFTHDIDVLLLLTKEQQAKIERLQAALELAAKELREDRGSHAMVLQMLDDVLAKDDQKMTKKRPLKG